MTDHIRKMLDDGNAVAPNAVKNMRRTAAQWRLKSTTLPPKEADALWRQAQELDSEADRIERKR